MENTIDSLIGYVEADLAKRGRFTESFQAFAAHLMTGVTIGLGITLGVALGTALAGS